MTEMDMSCTGGWEVEHEDLQRVTHTNRLHRGQNIERTANSE